jgi:ARG/rhodanese/phosphatase superfamily protein
LTWLSDQYKHSRVRGYTALEKFPMPGTRDTTPQITQTADLTDTTETPAIIVATEAMTESGGAQSPAETTAPSPTAGERRTASQVILDQLATMRVGVGAAHAGMTAFPVFASSAAASPLRYRTLEQAIAAGAVEVVEQASATVPELTLRNKGAVMIFVLDGEEVIGGRQNRIVNASFLIAANSTVTLPVTCVEHGRWHDVSPMFSSGESMPHAMRLAKHQQVSANLRATSRPLADQGATWDAIAEKQATTGTRSATGALHDIYRSQQERLNAWEQAFPYVPGAVGFIIGLGGQITGADLFDQPETAEALWPKLRRSYALDALEVSTDNAIPQEQAEHLLARARGARFEVYPSLALGEDARFEGDGVVGGGLVYEETPIHINLFRADEQTRQTTRAGMLARASQRRQHYTSGSIVSQQVTPQPNVAPEPNADEGGPLV